MNLDFIAYPLGKFLFFIYNTLAFNNYGLAIIIFTVVVKLVLLPLTVKQYHSTSKMQELQPLIQDIQKRYKNDKEKLNAETMKVYSENKVNPAGGCLPLLIQMPILLSLYWVIVQPLKFMLGKSEEQINNIISVATTGLEQMGEKVTGLQQELAALNYFNGHPAALSQVTGNLNASELINFNFLGLKLGYTATYDVGKLFDFAGGQAAIYLPLLILPIVGVITTYIATSMAMPKTKPGSSSGSNQQMAMANSMTNSMKYMGPIMTLIFSFQLPAGVVLYWIAGYVFQIGQQFYINKLTKRKKAQQEEKIAQQLEEQRALKLEEQKAIADNGSNDNEGNSAQPGTNSVGKSGGKADGKSNQSGNKNKYPEKKKGGGKK